MNLFDEIRQALQEGARPGDARYVYPVAWQAVARLEALTLNSEEADELRWSIGDPEDHYGDPEHPLITAKTKLEAIKDEFR